MSDSLQGDRKRALEIQEAIAIGSGAAFDRTWWARGLIGTADDLSDSPLSHAVEHNDLADYHYLAGRFGDAETHNALAIKYSQAAMNDRWAHLPACFVKSLALLRESDHQGALVSISDALAADGRPAELYYLRGVIQLATGNYQEAAQDLRRALTESPRWCRPLDLARLGKARLAELAEACTPKLDEPEEAKILYDQALRLAALGELDVAGTCLRKAVGSGLVLTVQRLDDVASAVWAGGRTQKAIESFLALLWSALSLPDGQLSRLVGKIGAIFSDVNDAAQSIDYTLAASSLTEGEEAAWLFSNLGNFLLDVSSLYYDPAAALREATTAVSLDESFASAWCCKAEACRRLSMSEEAVEAYRRCCALPHPSAPLGHFELAVHYAQRIGAEEADRLLRAARDLFRRYEQEAAETYTIAGMVYWLYAAARTCALLGDNEYRQWADKAIDKAFRTEGLMPYCWSLERAGTLDAFQKECEALDTLFQEHLR
jgi:tetratricopeptide (TPR) repeat protein